MVNLPKEISRTKFQEPKIKGKNQEPKAKNQESGSKNQVPMSLLELDLGNWFLNVIPGWNI